MYTHTLGFGFVSAGQVRGHEPLWREFCLEGGFTDEAEGGLTVLADHPVDTLEKKGGKEGGREGDICIYM